MQRRSHHRKPLSSDTPCGRKVGDVLLKCLNQPDRVFITSVFPVAEVFKLALDQKKMADHERTIYAASCQMLDEAFERNKDVFRKPVEIVFQGRGRRRHPILG